MVVKKFLSAAIFAAAIGVTPVKAQEITETHLEAALDALRSSPAARSYDDLLPAVAEAVKSQLILIRPDLHAVIGETVDEVVLTLVPRRSDLDQELARVWAQGFTEDELVTIAEFYNSPAGRKFNETGPRVISDSFGVAQAWAGRVREELIEATRVRLREQGEEF
ncbi:DUF2059 domain-containing protein [Bauldia sp.]|uniref:DUF2059 domain-containing protein n=1 Tax=Bauldia sp. TaxID=2575872 RepID=UPI003BAD950D